MTPAATVPLPKNKGGRPRLDSCSEAAPRTADPLPPHDPVTREIIDAPSPAKPDDVGQDKIDITQVPGLVGDVLDWIVKTSRQPNRVLALGAAITLVGTLMGRRVAGPTLSGTHLYIITLAPSGAGKDHALRQISTLMKAANAGHMIGPDDFMSMSSAIAVLKRSPACLCPMDEFGACVARISHPKASPHEKGISKTLRSAWAASFVAMQTPEWANTPSIEIQAPALSIYGNSTPGEFFGALQGADVVNGFLNRFLMIRTEVTMKDRDPDLDKFIVPDALRKNLVAFYADMIRTTDRERENPHSEAMMPTVLQWENAEAKAAMEALRNEVGLLRTNEALDPFYARTVEMTIRLATIVACGRKTFGTISVEDIRWGRAVAMMSALQMVEAAGDHMAGSEHARYGNRVIRFMKKKSCTVTKRDIHIALKGELKTKELAEVLGTMVEMGRIKEVPRERNSSGRPPLTPAYVLT